MLFQPGAIDSRINVFWWLRRDLRLDDNRTALMALKQGQVQPVFIFDSNILRSLEADDSRISFLAKAIADLKADLAAYGADLLVLHGDPEAIWKQIATTRNEPGLLVHAARDHESYGRERDARISEVLSHLHGRLMLWDDVTLFDYGSLTKADGTPYSVYTPFARMALARIHAEGIPYYDSRGQLRNLVKSSATPPPRPEDLGFRKSSITPLPLKTDMSMLREYPEQRDKLPADGTSHAGVYLRFGLVSARQLANQALHPDIPDTYLKELLWREFFIQNHFFRPELATEPFRNEYRNFQWENRPDLFEAWKNAETGYPLVDAGIRELVTTGTMHNRVRMLVASFLSKHLLIDWRSGERFFARHLLDFELASNAGNWQWAAGCGADAAPYFRIFNPELQARKFDPKGDYVRRFLGDSGELFQRPPVVEHTQARNKALSWYRAQLK